MRCPICKCALVDDGGVDNSEAVRRERLRRMQRTTQARPQPQIQEVELQAETVEYVEPVRNGVSALGIIALVFPILG